MLGQESLRSGVCVATDIKQPSGRGEEGGNYVFDMADRVKCKRIFHMNMLKQWHAPTRVTLQK